MFLRGGPAGQVTAAHQREPKVSTRARSRQAEHCPMGPAAAHARRVASYAGAPSSGG